MTLAAEKTYTADDLANDPALARFELVRGHPKERPVSVRSAKVSSRIFVLLATEADKTGDAEVFNSEMGYRCFGDDNTVRFPDVSVVQANRMPLVTEDDPAFLLVPADLVVEVISKSDRVKDVNQKIDEYLENGFALIWLVDPYRRTVQVFRQSGFVRLFTESDEITAEPSLPHFKRKVADFFTR